MLQRLKNFIHANKKLLTILIIGVLLTLIAALIYFLYASPHAFAPGIRPTPSPQVIDAQGDTILIETGKYHIVFLKTYNKYLISITGTPFAYFRSQAEETFLTTLGIDQQTACAMNVVVTTPRFSNPNEAGTDYPLSFCGPIPSPSGQINPNLADLTFQTSTPPTGEVTMGTTRNAVSFTFNKEVDLTSVQITSSPQLAFNQTYNPRDKKIVTLIPKQEWQSNVNYTITIKAGAYSLDRTAQLKQDMILNYQVKEVVLPGDNGNEFIQE